VNRGRFGATFKPLRRPDYVDPQEVNGDHEDEGMNRRRGERGLAAGKNATRTGRECQKNARAQHKKENGNQKVEHLYI